MKAIGTLVIVGGISKWEVVASGLILESFSYFLD